MVYAGECPDLERDEIRYHQLTNLLKISFSRSWNLERFNMNREPLLDYKAQHFTEDNQPIEIVLVANQTRTAAGNPGKWHPTKATPACCAVPRRRRTLLLSA
jgi:hypothetical protein